MSQRKKTAPPTLRHSRSSPAGRKGLIATEKTEKQSVRKRTVLDNRFYITFPAQRLRPAAKNVKLRIHASGPKSAVARRVGRDALWVE